MTVLRRCVDIGDVLAMATTGQAAVAVVSADLRRLDTEAVTRLRASGVAVVGVHPAADTAGPGRLVRIGITAWSPDDAGTDAVLAAARIAVTELGDWPSRPRCPRPTCGRPCRRRSRRWMSRIPTGHRRGGGGGGLGADRRARADHRWPPTSRWRRPRLGVPTLLMDADVYGGVVSSAFGLLDESPGLAGACRLAAAGQLDLGAWPRCAGRSATTCGCSPESPGPIGGRRCVRRRSRWCWTRPGRWRR